MSAIRCIYHPNQDGSRRDPGFPATDQHPQAVRYAFDHPVRGALNVDAVGGAPVLSEIDAILTPPPPSTADMEAACVAATSSAPAPQFGFDIQRAFIAHVVSCEAYRLGVAPWALTGGQLSAIRARVAAIYKALQ